MKTALLVIDIQKGLIAEKPYQLETFLAKAKSLIDQARKRDITVIYVRHQDEALIPGSTAWQIEDEIRPEKTDIIIDKSYNSAFKETKLEEILKELQVEQLIVIGMATNYCIDTTIKVAFEKGYEIIVPKGATTTSNNPYITAKQLVNYYEEIIWQNRFADLVEFDHL